MAHKNFKKIKNLIFFNFKHFLKIRKTHIFRPPFASTDPMYTYNAILKGVEALLWPKFMSPEAISLICKFCRREPTERLGYGCMDDARHDPWFKDFDFVSFRNQTMRPPIKPKVKICLKICKKF